MNRMSKRKKYKITVADEDVYEYRLSFGRTVVVLLVCTILIVLVIRILL